MELLRVRFDEQARSEKRKSAGTAIESTATGNLKPWREVVTPHKDVASGRYQQAEFAADLWQVHLGEGTSEYRDPVEFFRRTYLTESLKGMLVGAVRRLGGNSGASSGDPGEEQDFLLKTTFEHWLDERTLNHSISGDPDKTVLAMGIGEIEKDIAHVKEIISDLNIPQGIGEFDSAGLTDRYDSTKAQFRLRISGVNTIQERIRTRCLNYASRVEKQLDAQEKTGNFLSDVQNSVNSYFSSRSEDAYKKLQKVCNLLELKEPDDNTFLLLAVRRAFKSVADYFYPPEKGDIVCSDGETRKMGNEQYLNRLHEFCSKTFKSSTSNDLVLAELDYLMTFAKKLNAVASKGVHAEVTSAEAKQGFIGLYLFLFNVIEKTQSSDSQR